MSLIARGASQWVCAMGLCQLFFATGLAVCGFIVLGMFQNTACLGIWLGFPMMIPALLSVVTLATRRRFWSVNVIITNVVILAVSLYHIYAVHEETKYWERYRKLTEDPVPICYNRGDHCTCGVDADYNKAGYDVQYCHLYSTGEDLFWTILGLTVGGALFSLINIFMALWATISKAPKQMDA